jgi:peptidoglycan/xylan/chitin deacetylase (PgdA/CDA1 family)
MAYLAGEGYRCLALRDALPYLEYGKRVHQRAVVLTFDDGYENFYQEAYPILSEFGFTATVFAVAQEVGGKSRWDVGSETQLMSWSQIRELHRLGVEFGSHTMSHPRLTLVPPHLAAQELADSRSLLEQNLGSAVTSLAYPYGDSNSSIELLAREIGYSLACSIVRGNLHSAQDLLHLKRVPMDNFTSLSRLRRRLSPLYDYTSSLLRLSRRMRRQ